MRAVTAWGGRSSSSRPSSAGYLAGLVLVAVLTGILLGRAVGSGGGTAPPSGPEGEIEVLRSHLEARPTDAPAWRRLAEAHLQIAVEFDDTTHYLAADQAFLRADQLVAGHPEVARGRAVVALGLHHFDRAVELAGRAHQSRPRDPMALAALIDAEVEMGLYEAADGHLRALLALRPDVASLSRLSYLRQFHGDDEGALLAMLQARAAAEGSDREAVLIDVLLGEVFLSQGRLADAGAAFARAGAERPDLGDPIIGTARVMAAQGDVEGAIALLAPAMERAPLEKGLMVLTDLYVAGGDRGRADETVAAMRSFVDGEVAKGFGIDSEVPIFMATWGDPSYALQLAREVHGIRPRSTHASQALAWALFRSGDAAAAVPHIEEALRLGTNDARLHYHAAEIFRAVGQRSRAAEHLRQALSTGPHPSPGLSDDVEALAADLGQRTS